MSDNGDWRRGIPVLVTEAESIGSIAVIRSLGRAGYRVHACSTEADALGFQSNHAKVAALCPPYRNGAFVDWLRQYVQSHGIRVLIPGEQTLLGLRSAFAEFSPLFPFGNEAEVVYRGMSKFDVIECLSDGRGQGFWYQAAERVGGMPAVLSRHVGQHIARPLLRQSPHSRIAGDSENMPAQSSGHATPLSDKANEADASLHLPPTMLIRDVARLSPDEAFARLGAPLFIKADGCHARNGQRSATVRADSVEAAREQLAFLGRRFRKLLVQGYVPGQGVGAFFLIRGGKVLAKFMHRRLHEVPHTGGVSSLRESWWHKAIHDDALAKLRKLRWEGVAMMEYRWDSRSDSFRFIEMNGRFWGSLHLALYAGVDFPRLLVDAFCNRPVAEPPRFPIGLRCRHTFPKEVQYVWSRWKDKRLPLRSRLGSMFEFFALAMEIGRAHV